MISGIIMIIMVKQKDNVYIYCNSNPIINIDPAGEWAQNYKGVKKTSVEFNVKFDEKFLLKYFCRIYASDVIYNYGYFYWGFKYRGMSSTRIAKELYGHAVLYAIGTRLVASSVSNQVLNAILKYYGVNNKLIKSLKTVNKKIAYLKNELGMYLIQHAKYIEVNNNEKAYMLAIYTVIWKLGVI